MRQPKRSTKEVSQLLNRILEFEQKYPNVKPSSILSFVRWDLASYVAAKDSRSIVSPLYEGDQVTLGVLLLDTLIYSDRQKFDQLVLDIEYVYYGFFPSIP